MQIGNPARRLASPAFGDKHVSDQRPDARFHGRILDRPHACFTTPTATDGDWAGLVLSPKSRRALRSEWTCGFNGKVAAPSAIGTRRGRMESHWALMGTTELC